MRDILADEGILDIEFGRIYQPSSDEIKAVFDEYNEDGMFKYTSPKEVATAYRRVAKAKPRRKISKSKRKIAKKTKKTRR